MPLKRLILGSGAHWPKENSEVYHDTFLDIRPFDNVDIVHDLNELPWPVQDNSFHSIVATHIVEHLDSLLDFMNECHRIITPGGTLYLETPLAGGDPDLQYADPTHVRCYRPHSFINYMTIEGVAKFGYTDRCWGNLHIETRNFVIIVHAMPIK